MRPKAFIIVFTDKTEVKGALAVRFGVYCYNKGSDMVPKNFLKDHGHKYGYSSADTIRIL